MTALHLCIDMQRAYQRRFSAESWACLQANVSRLTKALECRRIPTLYVAYTFKLDSTAHLAGVYEYQHLPASMRATYDWRRKLQIDLRLNPNSLIAFKRQYSAFMEPSICDAIAKQGADTLIFSGLYEAQRLGPDPHFKGNCVSQTAHHFRMAGFKAILAADATNGGFHISDKADDLADAAWLTASEMSRRRESHALARRTAIHRQAGIDVKKTNEILEMLDRSAAEAQHLKVAGRI